MGWSSFEAARLHRLRQLALGLFLAVLGLAALAVILALAGSEARYTGWGFRGFPALLASPFTLMGYLILRRHPRHGLGWVFMALGVLSALQAVLFEYGLYALVIMPEVLPGGIWMAWALNWYWIFTILVLPVMLVIFPDGRLPSPRWRIFIWLLAAGTLGCIALVAVHPGPLDSSFALVENPLGWEAMGPNSTSLVNVALVSFLVLAFGVAVVGLIGRMRRSTGLERQQFKWFAFAGTLLLLTAPAGGAPTLLTQSPYIVAMLFVPVAIGIAILRHRLFDIDLIIRRTLVYAVLTAALALIYFGTVAVMQSAVTAISGQPSAAVTVISTLAIAAMFAPLRRWVQGFIDRRFYRRKYDAARTLADFGEAARDETDLDRLAARLTYVVADTMQPSHAGLWLVESTRQRPLGDDA